MSTTNKQLEQPAFNSYPDTWGTGPLNSNFGYIDTALGGSTTINATTHGGTVQALTASDVRPITLIITGAPSTTVTYEIPSSIGGQWIVRNNTSPGKDIYFRSASATGVVVTVPAGNNLQISCDGTATGVVRNSTAGVNAAAGSNTQVQYNSAGSLAGSANLTFDGTTLSTVNLTTTGNTTLGDNSGDILTFNSGGVNIPNGFVFGSNLLVVSPTYSNVGVGVVPSSTEKLIVAGTIYSTTGGIKFPDGTTQTTASTGGGGGGGVSSVSLNTSTTGLTVSGSNLQTITTTGTFLLGGVLNISNGGTQATTAAAAFNNLAPSQTGATGKYLTSDGTNANWSTLALNTGSTIINGGTSGYVLYNSAGVIGNFPLGVGVQTALGVATGTAGSFVVNGGVLGTPSSGNLSNCTNVSLSGVTGTLGVANGGTGSNLSSSGGTGQVLKQASTGAAITVGQLAVTDLSTGTTGTGSIVLASGATLSSANLTSPTLTTPALGTPSSGNLTNCTGFPGSGTNSGETYLVSDTTITNSSSWSTILQFTVPSTGTYYLTTFGQLNWVQGTSTDAQVYIEFGLGKSPSTSPDLGSINVCVVNAYNTPGIAGAVANLTAGQIVYLFARYTAAAGGNAYVRTGGGTLKGTKILYTRVA